MASKYQGGTWQYLALQCAAQTGGSGGRHVVRPISGGLLPATGHEYRRMVDRVTLHSQWYGDGGSGMMRLLLLIIRY